jgi:hypothetical protein
MFAFSIGAQVYFGLKEYNREMLENGGHGVGLSKYLKSGHFFESTFENWESEFLQMGLFVVLTISLRQKGSSESKDFGPQEVDREPDPKRKGAPWPVRRGGWILSVYEHSLTIAFALLFLISFALHFWGSWRDENVEMMLKGKPLVSMGEYLSDSRFWFESFQNWQSEFLSICAMIILTIWLRQKGSAQSKPVDAPNDQTGE